jgi:hypothetical protein
MAELSTGLTLDETPEDRVKSNSVSLIDELAFHAHTKRRNCSLHTSMLPTLDTYQDLEKNIQELPEENEEDILEDKRPSIFKTIIPTEQQN